MADREQETYEGSVGDIAFQNEENGYVVFDLELADGTDYLTAVGHIPYLKPGELLKVTGTMYEHPSYGPQLKVADYERVLPTTRSAILDYLSSGIIKGVRRRTAQKIVDLFGEETLTVLGSNPERLAAIPGISMDKAYAIGEAFAERQAVQSLVMFLQRYHISANLAMRVHKQLGPDAVVLIQRNPYILSEKVPGISFKMADAIASALGVEANNPDRVKAGVKYALAYYANSGGHTYLPRDGLVNAASRMLGVHELETENAVVTLLMEQEIRNDYDERGEELIFLKPLYEAERGAAMAILSLLMQDFQEDEAELAREIKAHEKETGIVLAPEQCEAVKQALTRGLLVITGGPGTGKTTTINTIIGLLENRKLEIALAAPTGRAAKRMTALTGREAKTIHRLLEITRSDDDRIQQFKRSDSFPLECDVLIVDEASMIDVLLLSALLSAVRQGTRLILVGDADQLPSVGAGNVLRDIIASERVPVVRLTTIFRQAEESMIVVNAHRINQGLLPEYNTKGKDFFFLEAENTEQISAVVLDLVKRRLPNAYGLDPLDDIQVITPMKKTPAGVLELNGRIQAALNPPSPEKAERNYLHVTFRVGDKVMQTRNNYDVPWERLDGCEQGVGIYNGDMGYIEAIENKNIIVVFDDEKRVVYDVGAMDELTLAYAITVHKSQGSEFRVIVMPMFHGAPMLMNRNLLYTAVTRARELVVLVGQRGAAERMVKNNMQQKRYSSLCRVLKEG